MITYPKDKEYLNLQQQVQKNKEDIARHYEIDRTLADYGIKIIGFYDTIDDAKDDLGDPYDGPFGNAVGIGISAPYSFYIWTRANNINDTDYWQDVGQLAVVGPQGIQGEQGEQGIPGQPARILTGANQPAVAGTTADIYITTKGQNNLIGDVYKIVDGSWQLQGNIRGPQGLQGEKGWTGMRGEKGEKGDKGDTGDPGGFIKISGFKVSDSELPDPEEIQDLEVAYLVGPGSSSPYHLWIQVGTNYENAVWHDLGVLNLATYTTVNGQFQNVWDADTKLDVQTFTSQDDMAYIKTANGQFDMRNVSSASDPYHIVSRGTYGEIYVPEWPEFPNEATSKTYVDGLIVDSPTITTSWEGPDLSLNLSADIVAEIGRSLKMPVEAPSVNSLVRITTDGQQQLISQGQFVLSSANAYSTKNSASTTIPMKPGYRYTFYPNGSGSLAISYMAVGSTSVQSTANLYRVELACISSTYAILTIGSTQYTASIPVSKLSQIAGAHFITFEAFSQGTITIA